MVDRRTIDVPCRARSLTGLRLACGLALLVVASCSTPDPGRAATALDREAIRLTGFPREAGGYVLRTWEIHPASAKGTSASPMPAGSITAHYGTDGGLVHASVTRVAIPGDQSPESWITHDRLLVGLRIASPRAEATERGSLRYGKQLVVYLRYRIPPRDGDDRVQHGYVATTLADTTGHSAYLLRAQSNLQSDASGDAAELGPDSLLAPLLRELLPR